MDVPERLAELRSEAAERLRDLEAELMAIAESTAASPDDEHDPEGSTVGFERARVGALLEQARRSLEEIDAARTRVRTGRYGLCVTCGDPISPERIEALPLATQCIACASR